MTLKLVFNFVSAHSQKVTVGPQKITVGPQKMDKKEDKVNHLVFFLFFF